MTTRRYNSRSNWRNWKSWRRNRESRETYRELKKVEEKKPREEPRVPITPLINRLEDVVKALYVINRELVDIKNNLNRLVLFFNKYKVVVAAPVKEDSNKEDETGKVEIIDFDGGHIIVEAVKESLDRDGCIDLDKVKKIMEVRGISHWWEKFVNRLDELVDKGVIDRVEGKYKVKEGWEKYLSSI